MAGVSAGHDAKLGLENCLKEYLGEKNLAEMQPLCAEPGADIPLYQAEWFIFRWYERMFAEFQQRYSIRYEDLFEPSAQGSGPREGPAVDLCRFLHENAGLIVPFADYATAREHFFQSVKLDKTNERTEDVALQALARGTELPRRQRGA